MVNKFFVADFRLHTGHTIYTGETFRGFDLARHVGYAEVIILSGGYMSQRLWNQKSAEETYNSFNFDRFDRSDMKKMLDFLDAHDAFYDIGVSFSDDPPYKFTMGLCLNKASSVLLRLSNAD